MTSTFLKKPFRVRFFFDDCVNHFPFQKGKDPIGKFHITSYNRWLIDATFGYHFPAHASPYSLSMGNVRIWKKMKCKHELRFTDVSATHICYSDTVMQWRMKLKCHDLYWLHWYGIISLSESAPHPIDIYFRYSRKSGCINFSRPVVYSNAIMRPPNSRIRYTVSQ
jgi:hypothetical protein